MKRFYFLCCCTFAYGTALHAAPKTVKLGAPKPSIFPKVSAKSLTFTPEFSLAFDPQGVSVLSPNGRILAVARGDVWIYRVASGELLKKIPVKTARFGLAFSPDGDRLAVGVAGPKPVYPPIVGAGEIQIWNWTQDTLEKTLPSYSYTPLRYSSDGSWLESDQVSPRSFLSTSGGWKSDLPKLAVLTEAIYTRWNVKTGEASRAVHPTHLPAAFASDGTTALTLAPDGATGIYGPREVPAAMNTAGELPAPTRRLPADNATSFVALSPDAKTLLQNTDEVELRRFDVQTGTQGASIKGAYPLTHVDFSADNMLLTPMFGFTSMAYDLNTNQVLWKDKPLMFATLAPDGRSVAAQGLPSTSDSHRGGRVQVEPQVWDLRSGAIIARIPSAITTTPDSFAIAPDGSAIALARGRSIEICALPNFQVQRHLTGFPEGTAAGTLVWSAPDQKLWTYDRISDGVSAVTPKIEGVRRFDLRDGAAEGALDWKADSTTIAPALAVSSDGRRVAASDKKSLRVWTNSGKLLWEAPIEGMRYLTFSPDGHTLVVGSDYNGEAPASVWNAETGQKQHDLDEYHTPRAPSFSPDGKILALGINLLRWPEMTLLGKCSGKQGDITPFTSWSRDGTRFLISRGFSADLWDVSKPKAPQMLRDWTGQNARFDLAHNTVWSATNNALLVMDARNGRNLAQVWFTGTEDWVGATSDGFFDGTPNALPYLRLKSGKASVIATSVPLRRNAQTLRSALWGQH